MTKAEHPGAPVGPPPGSGPRPSAVRIPPHLYAAAAARLVQVAGADRDRAARNFVDSAPAHGIDLSLMWGTIGRGRGGPPTVRQVCLVVLGAGRTAMVFPSGRRGPGPDAPEDAQDRAASVAAALAGLSQSAPGAVRIAQALLEPHEVEAEAALRANGFLSVGQLAYLRAEVRARPAVPPWPPAVEVRPVRGMDRGDPDRALLARALEASYIDTLDCPELCGLREIDDVIDSHRATGAWRAPHWRLVLAEGRPEGCVLVNPCPEQGTAELVYLGLSPAWRGRGLGRGLLGLALAAAAEAGMDSLTCAVDRRNLPALRLYESAGFREFGGRLALVRPLSAGGADPGAAGAPAGGGTGDASR